MSKNDLASLGAVYGGMLNGLKKDLIKEGKVGPSEVGDAPLIDGGATEKGGFQKSKIDIEEVGEKENAYNIKGLSYGNKNDPGNTNGPKPTKRGDLSGVVGDTEEDEEEFSPEIEKIAQESLNNFMKRKSVFDKLYDKVMVNENFGEEMQDSDFDALGLGDATPDEELGGEEDEVTITLSRELAQKLHDALMGVVGEEEGGELEGEDETEGESEGMEDEGGYEEDEEGIDTGSSFNTSYNDGKQNKVGSVKPKGGASFKGTSAKLDKGSHLNTSYNDGKQNKVGNLKSGQGAFE